MAQRLDVRYVTFQTDGSAARKAVEAKPFDFLKLPRVKKQRKRLLQLDPVALSGIVLSVVMVIALGVGFVGLNSAREDAERMAAYVQLLEAENEALTTRYHERVDLENVRITADALGLVPADQVRHLTVKVPAQLQPEEPGAWERFATFLAGLFA